MRKVLIVVQGGVAELVAGPADVEVDIRDMDNAAAGDDWIEDFTDEEIKEAKDRDPDQEPLTEMRYVRSASGYDYYVGEDSKGDVYNVVPTGGCTPGGGYRSAEYICNIKGVANLF